MIYAQIGDSLAKYEGMDLETITNMLNAQGLTFTVTDEATYLQKLAQILTEIKS